MELSILVAQVYAVVLTVVGLGLIFNPSYYRKALNAMMAEAGTVYMGGFMALIVGSLLLTHHWVWHGWPILVTLLGLIATIKGVTLILFPALMVRFVKIFTKSLVYVSVWGAFAFALGLAFAYCGWVVA